MEFLVWSGGQIVYSLTSLHLTEIHDAATPFVAPAKPVSALLGEIITSGGGTRVPEGVVTLTRASGIAFSSPPLELAPGMYRLSMRIERTLFRPTPSNESGLGLEVVRGSSLLAYRLITQGECKRGEVSFEFGIPSDGSGNGAQVEFRLRTIGLAEIVISALDFEKLSDERAIESFAGFDAILMLNAGTAGEYALAPFRPAKMAIHAKRGEEGNVSHGPYIWLPEGTYEAVFEFAFERGIRPAKIPADVVTNLGSNVLAEAIFVQKRRGLLLRMLGRRWGRLTGVLTFDVPADIPAGDNGQLEFRTWSSGRFDYYLLSLQIRKKQAASAKDL